MQKTIVEGIVAGNPAKVVSSWKEYVEKNSGKMVNLDGMTMEQISTMINLNPNLLIVRTELER